MTYQPSNQEAEESTIGCVLFEGRCYLRVAGVLRPDDFHHPALRAIYEAMGEIAKRSEPIDLITVSAEMRRTGALNGLRFLGGEAYLAELAGKVATIENVGHHARLVRDKSAERRIKLACSKVVDAIHAGRHERVEDLYAAAVASLTEAAGALGRSEGRAFKTCIRASLKRLEARYEQGDALIGIPSGWSELDEYTAGLQGGMLYVLAARPKMGKSALLTQLMVQTGVPTYVYSLEMAEESLTDRTLVQQARIDGPRFAAGALTTEDWGAATRAVSSLAELPIVLDDGAGQTLAEMRAKAHRWRSQTKGPAMVIVDYLQLVRGQGRNREQEVAEVSRGLKALAKDLHLPVVALAQVGRKVDDRAEKRPLMSDLRESGSIEADADLVIFLYRDEVYDPETKDPGIVELIIAANRHGPTGTVRLKWTGKYMRFDSGVRR